MNSFVASQLSSLEMHFFGLFLKTETILCVGWFSWLTYNPSHYFCRFTLALKIPVIFYRWWNYRLDFLADHLMRDTVISVGKGEKFWPMRPLTKAAWAGTRSSEPGICFNRPSTGSQHFLPTHKGVFHNQITAQSESRACLNEKQRRYFWCSVNRALAKACLAALGSLNTFN